MRFGVSGIGQMKFQDALSWRNYNLLLEQIPVPQITSSTEVLIKIFYVGICGSDQKGKEHGVMGHEGLGEVIQCGTKVNSLRPGNIVSFMTRFFSRRCKERSVDCYDSCEAQVDRCPHKYYESLTNGQLGVASQYVVMDERFLVRVPESLGVLGVLAEPMAVAAKGIQRLQNGMPIRDCSVLGTGKLGLMVLLALQVSHGDIELRGFDLGKGHNKQRFVEALGARYTDALEESIPKDAAEFIIETPGNPGLMPKIIAHAKPANSRIILMGYCEGKDNNIEIPPDLWDKLAKGVDLIGSTNFNKMHMGEGARYLQKAQQQYHEVLKTYITAIVPYKEYQRAFNLAKSPEHLKVVLEFEPLERV